MFQQKALTRGCSKEQGQREGEGEAHLQPRTHGWGMGEQGHGGIPAGSQDALQPLQLLLVNVHLVHAAQHARCEDPLAGVTR